MNNRKGSEFSMRNADLETNSGRRLMALGFALAAAWLLVLTMTADSTASNDPVDLAANPELSAARRWAQGAALAANPELAAAGRYARGTSRSAAAAANSEQLAAGRFTGPVSNLWSGGAAGLQNGSSFMAANPETMTARHYSLSVSECGLALGC